MTPSLRQAIESAEALVAKAKRILPDANAEDAEELRAMLADLQAAVERGSEDDIRSHHARGRGPRVLPRRRLTLERLRAFPLRIVNTNQSPRSSIEPDANPISG